jgi:predicted nucleic acid-binding Zn ribbon protein
MPRDVRGRSPSPRPVSEALEGFRAEIAPVDLLSRVQTVWGATVGPSIADVTTVAEERDGTIFIDCGSAVWTQELSLMEPRLRQKLADAGVGEGLLELRFRTVS